MYEFIAKRELLYSLKGEAIRKKLLIKISKPYLVDKESVDFEFSFGTSACTIKFDGLPSNFTEEVYGVDSIQALALATNLNPYLKNIEKKFDLFWSSGDPYFD